MPRSRKARPITHFPLCNTHLNVFPEFLQKHLLVLLVYEDLLAVVDEVIVLVGGQLLGLPSSSREQKESKMDTQGCLHQTVRPTADLDK